MIVVVAGVLFGGNKVGDSGETCEGEHELVQSKHCAGEVLSPNRRVGDGAVVLFC
jgi:hypothetical protein